MIKNNNKEPFMFDIFQKKTHSLSVLSQNVVDF